MKVVKIDM